MNTFKNILAAMFTAIAVGGLTLTQASAYDNCDHDSGYSYEQPRHVEYNDRDYAPPRHAEYGYSREYRRHHDFQDGE